MSTVSSNLSLPYIQASQAQKHVTHNEGMRILDSLAQLSVINTTLQTPPATPAPGDRYIVPAGATGDWAGQDNQLAVWDENAWRFFAALDGWQAWDQAAAAQLVFQAGQWVALTQDMQNLDMVGINTTADTTNRLAVSADATLLTHDASGDHQLKINKDTSADTASLLFQTNWQGRAEMGTTGSDDFEIKVSSNGNTFHQALVVDQSTGEVSFPNTSFAGSQFGDGELLTADYMMAKGSDLVANGTGLLENNYNMPGDFAFDPMETPNTAGSFFFQGWHSGLRVCSEFIGVNPNQTYRLGAYLKQEALPGDWSAFPNEDRHSQYLGLIAYDVDKNVISAPHHMRYKSGGVDSLTTLAAPLAPGDTTLTLTDASGWNDSVTAFYKRGVILLGYQNSFGKQYDQYSRLYQFDLFDMAGVDKTNNVITLHTAFPGALANPNDANGVWPAGTKIANSDSGGAYKYSLLAGTVLPSSGEWYSVVNHIGGVDLSGRNVATNFPPGTAYVKLLWLPNHTNRSGGYGTFPDTGSNHKVWFTGLSVTLENLAAMQRAADGKVDIQVPTADFATSSLSLAPPSMQLDLV